MLPAPRFQSNPRGSYLSLGPARNFSKPRRHRSANTPDLEIFPQDRHRWQRFRRVWRSGGDPRGARRRIAGPGSGAGPRPATDYLRAQHTSPVNVNDSADTPCFAVVGDSLLTALISVSSMMQKPPGTVERRARRALVSWIRRGRHQASIQRCDQSEHRAACR